MPLHETPPKNHDFLYSCLLGEVDKLLFQETRSVSGEQCFYIQKGSEKRETIRLRLCFRGVCQLGRQLLSVAIEVASKSIKKKKIYHGYIQRSTFQGGTFNWECQVSPEIDVNSLRSEIQMVPGHLQD